MATKPTGNNSNVLVAIAKLETKMDILTTDVRDLKDGMKADIEFLKVDKISRAEAVRVQTDTMTQHQELVDKITEQRKEIDSLKESRIAYRASLRVWVILGGGTWTIIVLALAALIGLWIHA